MRGSQKYLILIFSLWLCSAGSLTPVHESPKPADFTRIGKDYALFFAVDDYSNASPTFTNLRNPIKDATEIAWELEKMYGFETHIYRNPSKSDIIRELTQWRQKAQQFQEDAQLFVFFSGHGTFWDFNLKGYFVPFLPSGTRAAYESYIDLTDIGNSVAGFPCNHILLAIDACYAGTIDQAIAFRDGDYARPGASSAVEKQRIVSTQLLHKSRLLLTSGGKVRTPDGVNNSPFSGAIIGALRDAYTRGDGLLMYSDLLARLKRVNPLPHEGVLPGHASGGFVFVANTTPNPQVNSPVTPSPAAPIPAKTEPVASSPATDTDASAGTFVLVQGGSFDMGCTSEQQDCDSGEKPVRRVTLNSYYIGQYEVTQAQWRAVMGNNPSNNSGCDQCPVEQVSWNDVQDFLRRLNARTGQNYRIPTEAEWEFAARGGSRSRGDQ